MIPHSFDSGSELLIMWSSKVADVWVILVGSVISGISECVNKVFKKLDVALLEVWFSRLKFRVTQDLDFFSFTQWFVGWNIFQNRFHNFSKLNDIRVWRSIYITNNSKFLWRNFDF